MDFESLSQNQRKWFRCVVARSRERCVLRVGECVLPGKLVDQSAGGFSVLVDELAGLEVDQTAELTTDVGSFEVRAAHISKVMPTETNVAADREAACFRIGLIRLREVGLPQEPKTSIFAGSLQSNVNPLGRSGEMKGVVVVFLVIATLAVLTGWWRVGASGMYHLMQAIGQQMTSPAKNSSPNTAQSKADDSRSSANSFGRREDGSAFSSSSGSRKEDILSAKTLNRYLRMPGAAALTMPEVVDRLRLTADQQSQMYDLTSATSKAIRHLDATLQGQPSPNVSKQREELLKQARQEALKVLTSEQRVQWDAMTSNLQ